MENDSEAAKRPHQTRARRYILALGSVAGAAVIRAVLDAPLGDRAMYLSFWPAVMVSSWYGGLGPGALSAVLSTILIQLFWIRSRDVLIRGVPDIVAQCAFFVLAILISILNEQRLRAIQRASIHERVALARYETLQQEIKERKELEADLIEANRSLARSNEDLTGFGHMISHDLQEPLRTMILYSELLKRRYAEPLGAQGAEWLEFIESSGKRLTGMIRNLLDYARAGTVVGLAAPEVDLNNVVAAAKKNLTELIISTSASVTADRLPVVPGDELQLCSIFQNLIANAIKYRRQGIDPSIHVSARSDDGFWTISVRDNGSGVEESQRERIFKPFFRGSAQSDGSGIGLATCRRIVERHGGKIWLETAGESGSTFSFSIAKRGEQAKTASA